MRSYLQRLLALASLVLLLAAATAAQAKDDAIELSGLVNAMPATGLIGDWTIAGTRVSADGATTFDQERGTFATGAIVEVSTVRAADGSLRATRIELKQAADAGNVGSPGTASSDNRGSPDGSGSPGAGGSSNPGSSSDNGASNAGELRGTVEALPLAGLTGSWRVSGRAVTVVAATRIDQEAAAVMVGAVVEIHGALDANGVLIASTIEVVTGNAPAASSDPGARMELLGTIEALPSAGLIGTWTVSQRQVVVSASTALDREHGAFTVGAAVEVNALKQRDGALAALRIEAKAGQGAAVPAARFWGRVTALPDAGLIGVWSIEGKLVDVTAATTIKTEHGPIALQSVVEVQGWVQTDGVVAAKEIETRATLGDLEDQGSRAVEFENRRLGRFFLTAAPAEIEALDHGAFNGDWQRTGETFKVGGTQAVCRFYGMPPRGPDSHFFTADATECSHVMAELPAWTFEGFAFTTTSPGSDGQCPAGLVPVHRLYNQAMRIEDLNHRYVVSAAALAATVALGWVDEGIVMCAQP